MSHVFYVLVHRWFEVLPVDEAGRRVFDETLADWRREAARASGPLARVLMCVRAVFAVLRAVVGVSFREVMLIRRSGMLVRVFLWTAGYLLAMTLIIQLSPEVVDLSVVSQGYFLVSLVAFIFPVALLLATGLGRARQPVPALGAALVALLVGAPLLGWALPIANRAFMVANPWSYVTDSGVTRVVPSKPGEGLMLTTMSEFRSTMPVWPPNAFRNDLTVAQLGARVVEGPQAGGWNAIR